MILKILFALCLVVEVFCVPWYLKALWPEKCRKSLILKMVCATGFVCIGILSMLISGNFSDFAVTMVIGTIFGWIGDYFLHAKPSNAYFATGFVSFLIGHIAYIIAFVRATPVISADYDMFNLKEVFILIGIVAAAIVMSRVLKVKFAPRIVELAIWIYVITITIMLIRASALGMCYWSAGGENGLIAFLVLTLGAVFFLMSDVTLGLIIFGGQKKNYPLKIFNILTYFWGQVMLASSILFINA